MVSLELEVGFEPTKSEFAIRQLNLSLTPAVSLESRHSAYRPGGKNRYRTSYGIRTNKELLADNVGILPT